MVHPKELHPIHKVFDELSVKSVFRRSRKVERVYSKMLRRVASHVGDIIRGFPPDDGDGFSSNAIDRITRSLRKYAETIQSWAEATAERMIREVAARDESSWVTVSRRMGKSLRKEIASTPVGEIVVQRLAEQVDLITSLPREAAERVHQLALEGMIQGTRPREIAEHILETEKVTESRAMLIARTEVGRTSTELTRARAEKVGSTHFIWRTAGDSDVRPSHRRLDGRVFRWDDPPECDPPHRALPGAIWNCRCYPEPILTED